MSERFDAAYDLHLLLAHVRTVRHLRYQVALIAPENLYDLNASATSCLIVYGEYSSQTIYGEPSGNHCQRAWHDTIHQELQAHVDAASEYRVARQQALEAERLAGTTLADLLWADLWGQTCYFTQFADFPTDQASFVWHYLKTGKLPKEPM